MTDPKIRQYFSVKDRLSLIKYDIVVIDDRIVFPKSLRTTILKSLHSAHQGVSSMTRRAKDTMYWPGLDADIHNTRYTCKPCNEMAPSQPKEPLIQTTSPSYPFQLICMDYFSIGHYSYLVVVDRFTGWPMLYYFRSEATARELISICREIFTSYGVAEEVGSDGGPQFKASEFEIFLKNWGICH